MNEERSYEVGRRLKALRERAGRSVPQIAQETGLSAALLYDLEATDDLYDTVSLDEINRLARALGVKPSMLFNDAPSSALSRRSGRQRLPSLLLKYLAVKQLSIEQFEERVGYEVRQVLSNPGAVRDWNAACLMAVASELGLCWLEYLEDVTSTAASAG